MPRSFVTTLLAVSVLAAIPASSSAQNQDPPLSALLPNLYLDALFEEYFAFVDAGADDEQLLNTLRNRFVTDTFPIIRLAGNQLSSFPLASASGGCAWTFDTGSGAFTRASNSFGPIFAERPLTIGRGRLNVGGNFQHVTFDRLEERRLRGGEIVSYLNAPLRNGDQAFFANVLDLKVTSDTLGVFATYGVTDRLDVGVAVPINRVDVRATVTPRFGFTSRGIVRDFEPFSDAGTRSGIGDVVVRAKYNMLKGDTWGIAEAVDVRLPTGDELNLLGVAGGQVKLSLIASSAMGMLSPHMNLGYTISGTSSAGDDPLTYVSPPLEEFNYAAGADLALSLRTTVAVDVVGRVIRYAGSMAWRPSEFGGAQYPQFDFTPGPDLHLMLGSAGLKLNPFGNMLITTNVLFPLAKNGLTDNLTWMGGVEYSF